MRCFLDLIRGDEVLHDQVGIDLIDEDVGKLREIVTELVSHAKPGHYAGWQIYVRNSLGKLLYQIDLTGPPNCYNSEQSQR